MIKFTKSAGEPIGLDWKFPFGKYKGQTIEEVPLYYVQWCIGNLDYFEDRLTPEVYEYLESCNETNRIMDENQYEEF